MILNIGLPFSNLGTFIPELIEYEKATTEKGKAKDLMARILMNEIQILNYLKRYYDETLGNKAMKQYIPKFEKEINEKLDEFFSTLDEELSYEEAIERIYEEKEYVT